MVTKLLNILFADMIKSNQILMKLKQREDHELKSEIRNMFQVITHKYAGNIARIIGQGYLITFESPTDSVLCALQIQNRINNWRHQNKNIDIRFRMGLNIGEVGIDQEGGLSGEAVPIAVFVASCCEPGGVCISTATYHAMNKA